MRNLRKAFGKHRAHAANALITHRPRARSIEPTSRLVLFIRRVSFLWRTEAQACKPPCFRCFLKATLGKWNGLYNQGRNEEFTRYSDNVECMLICHQRSARRFSFSETAWTLRSGASRLTQLRHHVLRKHKHEKVFKCVCSEAGLCKSCSCARC